MRVLSLLASYHVASAVRIQMGRDEKATQIKGYVKYTICDDASVPTSIQEQMLAALPSGTTAKSACSDLEAILKPLQSSAFDTVFAKTSQLYQQALVSHLNTGGLQVNDHVAIYDHGFLDDAKVGTLKDYDATANKWIVDVEGLTDTPRVSADFLVEIDPAMCIAESVKHVQACQSGCTYDEKNHTCKGKTCSDCIPPVKSAEEDVTRLLKEADGFKLSKDQLAALTESVNSGAIYKLIQAKRARSLKAGRDPDETYGIIGVMSKNFFGSDTAMIEIWPAGHRSPVHHHGGCNGGVKLLVGEFDVGLYDKLTDRRPSSVVSMEAGDSTSLTDIENHIHAVLTEGKDNPAGYAASLHLYASCSGQTAWHDVDSKGKSHGIKNGMALDKFVRRMDFYWIIDADDHDPRRDCLNNGYTQDFEDAVLKPYFQKEENSGEDEAFIP